MTLLWENIGYSIQNGIFCSILTMYEVLYIYIMKLKICLDKVAEYTELSLLRETTNNFTLPTCLSFYTYGF